MAQIERDAFDKPGQYNLTELAILSYRQNKEESLPNRMDIKGITFNFEIAEDILTNNVVGSVIVYDMQDVRTLMPLTGLERISIKFNSPGIKGYDYSEDTGIPLQIYKVDKVKRDPDTDGGQLYQIFFCSPEMYKNSTTRVSRAYAGPVENGVIDIVKNYLKSEKPIYVEPTSTNAKYVIPNLKPYQAINYLCSQAKSGKFKNNAGYVFYETSKGFYFRSIASMMGLGGQLTEIPPKWKFSSIVTSVTENEKQPEIKDVERRLSSVIRYEFEKPIDMLDNINSGFYANRVIVHDAFNKTITTTDFDYIGIGTQQPHTEMSTSKRVGLLYPENGDGKGVPYADTNKGLNELPLSKLMVTTETSKVHNNYEFTPTKEILPLITNQKATMRNMNLSLLVYGNTLINAGDIITFTSPIMRPTGHNEEVVNSPYTSGRYIILAIKHTVNVEAQRHEMVLKCYKDSVRSAYPTESEALSSVGKGNFKEFNLYEEQLKDFQSA